jgi:ribosomal protein S18 acetylase RimI-like enzyme
MSSPDSPIYRIRKLVSDDRVAVAAIVQNVGNFSVAEIRCALELVDLYLHDPQQQDYRFVVAEDLPGNVCGYACWGPTPLTRGTYDLYWIATSPALQGHGIGRTLMAHVENQVAQEQGRLLIVETSAKASYGGTVGFYRNLGYDEASRIGNFYDIGDDKLTLVKRFSC